MPLLSNQRVHTLKERQGSILFLLHTSSKKEDSRSSLHFLIPTGKTPKRKKTLNSPLPFTPTSPATRRKLLSVLSSSLPLILLGPATKKGKSFHVSVR